MCKKTVHDLYITVGFITLNSVSNNMVGDSEKPRKKLRQRNKRSKTFPSHKWKKRGIQSHTL